jgi:hypothetical protein
VSLISGLFFVAWTIVTVVQLSAIWREWVKTREQVPAPQHPPTRLQAIWRRPITFLARAALVIGGNFTVFYLLRHAK